MRHLAVAAETRRSDVALSALRRAVLGNAVILKVDALALVEHGLASEALWIMPAALSVGSDLLTRALDPMPQGYCL